MHMLLKTKARTGFRAVAAVAVAAVAGSLAAAAPTAAQTDDTTKASSSISIRVTPQQIEAGETTKVLGNLKIKGPADDGGRAVTLEAKAKGETAFTPVGDDHDRPERQAAHRGRRRASSTRYRWHFAGADDARPRRSGVAQGRRRRDRRRPRPAHHHAVHPGPAPPGRRRRRPPPSSGGCARTATASRTAGSSCCRAPRRAPAGRSPAASSPTATATCTSRPTRTRRRPTG